jgi:hypothetical protein
LKKEIKKYINFHFTVSPNISKIKSVRVEFGGRFLRGCAPGRRVKAGSFTDFIKGY